MACGGGVTFGGCPRPRRGGGPRRGRRRRPARASRPAGRRRLGRRRRRSNRGWWLGRGRQPGASWPGTGPTCFAVCLFVLGAIFALGLWTELAGPVGSALADGSGAVLGRARVAIPVACFAFGVVLLWPRRAGVIDLEAETVRSRRLTTRRPSRRRSASPSARSSSSSPTSASCTSPTAGRRSVATSTTCAAPAARSARWSRARSSPPSAWSAHRSCSAPSRSRACSSCSDSRSA